MMRLTNTVFVATLAAFPLSLAAPEPAEAASAVASQKAGVGGTYDSNWGAVKLAVSGNKVTGTYRCCGGGTIAGELRGNVIVYAWKQQGAAGRGVWAIVDGDLIGTWGSGQSVDDGGVWSLRRPRQ